MYILGKDSASIFYGFFISSTKDEPNFKHSCNSIFQLLINENAAKYLHTIATVCDATLHTHTHTHTHTHAHTHTQIDEAAYKKMLEATVHL